MFALGKGKKWKLLHSGLFLDFLAGNREYHCTPWGMPTRNIFGWQKPCYLLGEGYVKTFKELMETTDWDIYGTGKYEKCANCMAHCGYEPTAAHASISNPLTACGWPCAASARRERWRRKFRIDGQRPAIRLLASRPGDDGPHPRRPARAGGEASETQVGPAHVPAASE